MKANLYKSVKFLGIGLCLSLLLGACTADTRQQKQLAKGSLEEFFYNETQRLSQTKPEVLKTIAHNDKKETKTLQIKDWGQELSIFASVGLDNPKIRDKYKIDTLPNSIRFQALTKEVVVQAADIQRENGQIRQINFALHTQNLISDTQQFLTYEPQKGYIIVQTQKIWGGESTQTRIETRWGG
jgi:hypothetical protein